ncbi:MAG: hypothetical protein WEB04_09350 [Dehalococcoidia bacterium]
MKLALVLAASALCFVAMACGGGGGSPDETRVPEEAQALIDAALSNMRDAESYRASYVLRREEDPQDERDMDHWDIFYQRPDRYRVLLFSPVGDSEEVCEEERTETSLSSSCHTVVTNITGETVFEAVLVGDRAYGRPCEGINTSCEDWMDGEREVIPAFGLSSLYVPGWPLVAVEQATDLHREGDGTIRGRVRVERAVVDNMHRLAVDAGMPEDEFEDFAGIAADDPSLDASPPDDIKITLSADRRSISSIELSNAASSEPFMTIDFSEFGDIEIEVPD